MASNDANTAVILRTVIIKKKQKFSKKRTAKNVVDPVDVTLEFIATRIFSDTDPTGTADSLSTPMFPRSPKSADARTQVPCVRTHTHFHVHADKYTRPNI